MPPSSPHLAVLLDGEVVAEVDRGRSGALRLTFTKAARRPGRTPLSLSLPTSTGTITGTPVETFLDGLLPDNDAVRRAIARVHGADANDTLSLLAAVGQDCPGAVQLCLPEDVHTTAARTGELIPVSDSDVEMRLAALRTDMDASWTMPGEHWSLGGSQQKFALRLSDGQWFEATGSEPTSHIVKPGIYALRAQAMIEHVSMHAATRCGVSAAHTEYVSFKSEDAIVITRFDRAPSVQAGGLRRLHQEDLCQALGVREKYESEGGPDAETIVRLLRESSSTARAAAANVARFVDGLVYNTVIAAPDAHARNYAVLLQGDDVKLAPLFDVATGLAYEPPAGGARALSMSIAGEFDPAHVTPDTWKRFCEAVSVDEATVLDKVREVAEVAPDAMAEALAEIDDWDGAASDVAARLLPGVREQTQTVLRAL